jgi:catechol 2,3-dioxygenase-like lactoylglutathione lyase family enzyme
MSSEPSKPSAPGAVPALGVHHLAVKVRDLARAETFWCGALGLQVMRRHADEGGAPRAIWLALEGGAFLAVERAEAGEPLPEDAAPGWHCIALGIGPAEREGWRTRLTERGHPIVRETAYTLYVRDPDGAIVALSHYPHPVVQTTPAEAGATAATSDPPASAIEAGPDTALEGRSAGVTSRLAALVTLSAAVLAWVAFPPGAGSQRRPADAMLIGSSSVEAPFGRQMAEHFEAQGMRISRVARRSTGLARPDFFDWQEEIPNLGELARLRGVMVYMGGNDIYALRLRRSESRDRGPASWVSWNDEARWTEIYTGRVHTFVEALCMAGARRTIVILPTDGDREGWADRIHRVQDAQSAGVRGTTCGVVIDPRGRAVRSGDTLDGVHLSTRGARELMQRIGPVLIAALAG